MSAVYKKELRSYFSTMAGYISIAMILLLTGVFVRYICFRYQYAAMQFALPSAAIILMLAVPILTMSSFSGERQQKTDQLLYSLPLKTWQIVLGKYGAMMTVMAVPVLIMCLYPLILSIYGSATFSSVLGGIYGSLVMFYLEIAAMTAICMFLSSLTESPVVAAVLGAGALIFCYFAQLLSANLPSTPIASFIALTVLILLLSLAVYWFVKNYWAAFGAAVALEAVMLIFYLVDSAPFSGLFTKVIGSVSLFTGLENAIENYVFDLNVVIYYLSVALLFGYLTTQTVEKRRWS